MRYAQVLHLMLLYHISAVVKLFLADGIGDSAMLTGNSSSGNCILSLAFTRLALRPCQMYLFLGIAVHSHCRMLWTLLSERVTLLFCIASEMWYSMFIHSLLILVFLEVHIHLL